MSFSDYPVNISSESSEENPLRGIGTLRIDTKEPVDIPNEAQLCSNVFLEEGETYVLHYTTNKKSEVSKVKIIGKPLETKGTHHFRYNVEPLFTIKIKRW